jgi:THO complex subunit 2
MSITEEQLIDLCRRSSKGNSDDEHGAAVVLSDSIFEVMESVQRYSTAEMDVEKAADGIETLTNTLEFLLEEEEQKQSDTTTTPTSILSEPVIRFVNAFSIAAWAFASLHSSQMDATAPTKSAAASSSSSSGGNGALPSILKAILSTCSTSSSTTSPPRTVTRFVQTRLLQMLGDAHLLETTGVLGTGGTDPNSSSTLATMTAAELVKRTKIINTTIHYRQHKFHLLAEESEGYAKFLHLLLVASSSLDPNPNNLYAAVSTVIGTFSLDPNRCMDICMDVLEYYYYHEYCQYNNNNNKTMMMSLVWSILTQLDQGTRKLPAIVGFKLRGRLETGASTTTSGEDVPTTTTTTASTPHTPFPPIGGVDSLLQTMAWVYLQPYPNTTTTATVKATTMVLDAAKIISFLPDVTPWVDQLDQVFHTYHQYQHKRLQALGKTSLSSSNTTTTTTDGDKKIPAEEEGTLEVCQKQLREKSLAIRWMLFVMTMSSDAHHGRDPTNNSAQFQPVSSAFPRIRPVFEPYWSQLSMVFPDIVGLGILDWVQTQVSHWLDKCAVVTVPWSRQNHHDKEDHPATTSTPVEMVLDDDEKDDNNEAATMMQCVLDAIVDPLDYVRESGCIRMRPTLYTQLCRLFTVLIGKQLKHDPEQVCQNEDLIYFLRTILLPSLSLFPSNPSVSMELWSVLQQLPYRIRYGLYRSWRGNGLERESLMVKKQAGGDDDDEEAKPAWLVEGEIAIGKDARYALKRLSKDTIRDMSRAVAKSSHSHPLVVFSTILNQIEAYDNLIQVMVDACRFVTPLSLDVLGFCILQRLMGTTSTSAATAGRSKVKESGFNVSQWLQSLESFTGSFYKRFPHVEFQGILCYLTKRLSEGQVMELGVLRTLLKNAAGWSFEDYAPAASLSSTQLEGRAGSTMLKRETMAFGVVDDISIPASNEVRRVLQTEANLGVSILILLSQVRNQIVFGEAGRPKPVKLIGNLVDICQVTMSILLNFLTNDGRSDEEETATDSALVQYAKLLPSLSDLYDGYKLEVADAWLLCRPLIHAAQSMQHVDKMDDGSDDPISKFRPTEEFQTAYKKMLPSSAWSFMTVDLFETFYSLSLRDLVCPEDVYSNEISRLTRESERLSQKQSAPQPAVIQPGALPEKSDKEELERVKNMISTLTLDCSKQKEAVSAMHEKLSSKASTFFALEVVSEEAAIMFLKHCVYPRCMQGPDDAMYCAHFVSFLHKNNTSGFSTLHFYDALIVTMSRSLFCLTEGEAACVSILLTETWKTVSHWRYDDDAFEDELLEKEGSIMEQVDADGTKTRVPVSKDGYRKLYNKWHSAIGSTCLGCLESKEYMHLRNCLVVLSRMVELYPTRPVLANKLLSALEPLQSESNAFSDIRASAQAYNIQLVKARDDGVWKEEDEATVKARLEREEAAAAKRHKKAEEQMEQIKRDTQKITEEIGEWDSRDRSRGRSGGFPGRYDPQRNEDRMRASDDRRRGNRPPPPIRDPTQHIVPEDRRQRDARSTAPATGAYAAIVAEPPQNRRVGGVSSGGEQGSRTLEGRWEHRGGERDAGRGIVPSGRKRSRPSSPEQGETQDDQQPEKRSKTNADDESRRRGASGSSSGVDRTRRGRR